MSQTCPQCMRKTRAGIGSLAVLLILSPFALTTKAAAGPNPVLSGIDYYSEDEPVTVNLILTNLDVEVEVSPGYATTTATATFRNPVDEEIEGTFYLDMPAHSIVTGYGLEIEGRLVPGVIAEKKGAKKIFEERIREGVDPGLGDITHEGAFTTRVFPIFAEESRTISVTFVSPITSNQPYALPIQTSTDTDNIDVRVSYRSDANRPAVQFLVDAPLSWDEPGRSGGISLQNAAIDSSLLITPTQDLTYTLERANTGEIFLEIALPVEDSDAPDPSSVRVYWDTSLSQESFSDPLAAFTGELVRLYQPDQLELTTFANGVVTQDPRNLNDADELGRAIDGVSFNGATNLSRLFESESTRKPVDVCLLITNGHATIGTMPEDQLPCVLHTISSSSDANRGALRLLATTHNGRYADISTSGVAATLAYLRSARSSDVEVLYNATSEPAQSVRVNRPNDERRIYRFKHVPDSIRLKELNADLDVDARPIRANTIAAAWAEREMESLRASNASRQSVVDVSQKYAVAGEETSFVVYEEIFDYMDVGVRPPPGVFSKDEMADFEQHLAEVRQEQDDLAAKHMEWVVESWQGLQAWYDKKHVPGEAVQPGNRPDRPESGTDVFGGAPSFGGGGGGGNSELLEEIVVTGSRVTRSSELYDAPVLTIAPWSPDRPYINAVRGLCGFEFEIQFFALRDVHGSVPSYFLDMGDAARDCGDNLMARDIYLSALELPTANSDTVTAVANRLLGLQDVDLAIQLFAQVVHSDTDRPQPLRDLATALARYSARQTLSIAKRDAMRQEALALLDQVITTPWDEFYDGIELIATMEANRIINLISDLERAGHEMPDARLRRLLDVDVRIVLTWNADIVDIDLWVKEPNGERAYYNTPLTSSGGWLSNDMTDGYGPEEYWIRHAPDGEYEIYAHYYSSDMLNPNGAVVVGAEITRNWGRADESTETVYLEFESDDEKEYLLATIEVGANSDTKNSNAQLE